MDLNAMEARQRKEDEQREFVGRYRAENARAYEEIVDRLKMCKGSTDVRLVKETLASFGSMRQVRIRILHHNVELHVRNIL